MHNKNYEFVRRNLKGIEQILKTSENLAELVLLKRNYRNNTRNTYEIRPEVVRVKMNTEQPLCISESLM